MRDLLPMMIKVEQVLQQLNADMTNVMVHSTAFEDNNGALILAMMKKMTPRSKHIAIKYHHFKQAVFNGFVKILKVNSEQQLADIFTKGLGSIKFQANRLLLCGW
jgi:cysteine sulfinate desulfinase/cysteine desulfurase-like protein